MIIVDKEDTNELLTSINVLLNKLAAAEREISRLNTELRASKKLLVEISTRSNDKG